MAENNNNSLEPISLPQLVHNHEANDDKTAATTEHQLSQDLALFLANPSLRAALSDGSLDLASYSTQLADELADMETTCVTIYRQHVSEISELSQACESCESVLAALFEMLRGFQADLGGLSGEIRQLQEKSRMLDVQLKNRRSAEEGLRQFLEKTVIGPSLAHTITTSTTQAMVNPTFVQAVQELNQLYRWAGMTTPQDWSCGMAPSETTAGQELQAHLQTLRLVAASRIRNYFLQQLTLLRRPQTNVRMIQVHGLIKYAVLQDFLEQAAPELASEIYQVYCETISMALSSLFRTYQAQLLQLDTTKTAAGRYDVICMEDAMLRDTLTSRAKKRVDVFCLGTRATDCLQGLDNSGQHPQPILAHVALAENQFYPYERLFKSLLGHLVDAVTNEHVFCRQFFKRDAFEPLFGGTLSLLLEQLENYLFSCFDAVCLLLVIKVTHSYKRLTHARRIHSLDGFFDQVTVLVWPRLKTVMDGHLRSLQAATATKLGGVDLHAHYVSRRLAEFVCSILLILRSADKNKHTPSSPKIGVPTSPKSTTRPKPISTPTRRSSVASVEGELVAQSAGEKLLQDLQEMIQEYLVLLERLAEVHSSQKKKIVFCINNLDQVVSIFQERRVVGKEFNIFVEQLMRQREYFVEVELLTGFSKMIAFVQQTEADMAASSSSSSYQVNIQEVEALVLDFASNWRSNIEQINRNVLSYFSNFRNGMEILKQVLTQLLLYYTRFQDLIRKIWRNKLPAFCKDLVSTTMILAEIKKYALAI